MPWRCTVCGCFNPAAVDLCENCGEWDDDIFIVLENDYTLPGMSEQPRRYDQDADPAKPDKDNG